MTIRIPAFCLAFYLASAHFGGELQHFGHMGEQKIKRWPIRTREITGVKLQDQLYDYKVRTSAFPDQGKLLGRVNLRYLKTLKTKKN